jgi:hypothetical protein
MQLTAVEFSALFDRLDWTHHDQHQMAPAAARFLDGHHIQRRYRDQCADRRGRGTAAKALPIECVRSVSARSRIEKNFSKAPAG